MKYRKNTPELKRIRQKLRGQPTESERKLWGFLRHEKLGVRFFRQYSVDRYIADFCCPTKKLIIEIDGITHDAPEVQQKDAEKQKRFEQLGFTVLRFGDEEVRDNPEGTTDYIRSIIS